MAGLPVTVLKSNCVVAGLASLRVRLVPPPESITTGASKVEDQFTANTSVPDNTPPPITKLVDAVSVVNAPVEFVMVA